MSLSERFLENWKDSFKMKEPILLAVSGGADSMVMSHLFASSKIDFAIAHCNFQLRGTEADEDEHLVAQQAKLYNVPFYVVKFDTQRKAGEWKKGIQETARILRYTWLEEIRKNNGYASIATAHHANDNAETLLMNLFKGTGMLGLHGIPQINDHIIRPLLFAEKKDITHYVQTYNIAYREDASNASDKYLRNAVRLNILPEIEKVFPNIIQILNDNINRFVEIEEVYKKGIDRELKTLIEVRGKDIYIPIKKLRLRKPFKTICYELFKQYGFNQAQIPHIIKLFDAVVGSTLLSSSHRVLRDRDFLIITDLVSTETDLHLVNNLPHKLVAPEGVFTFSPISKPKVIPSDTNQALVDMDSIVLPLKVRRWKQGDYFYPLGMKMKKKKLSDFFIDNKLPLHHKESLWVVECNKKIIWVAGMRLDERFKLKGNTQNVLSIEFKPTKN